MGWKASCLLANAREPGFPGEFPRHDPKRRAPLLEAAGLHSVVNFFGYAWYEDGRLKRVRAGAADEGVWIDFGEPLS